MKPYHARFITIAAAALLPGAARAQTAADQSKPWFPDVPKDHWAYNAVQRLAHAGIIEGYPGVGEQRHAQGNVTVVLKQADVAADLAKLNEAERMAAAAKTNRKGAGGARRKNQASRAKR